METGTRIEKDWTSLIVDHLDAFSQNYPIGKIISFSIVDGYTCLIHHVNDAGGGTFYCSIHEAETQKPIYAKILNPFYTPPDPWAEFVVDNFNHNLF